MSQKHHEQLDELLAQLSRLAHDKLNKAFASSAVPEQWLSKEDSCMLPKAVLDSVCRDRPFSPLRPDACTDFDNLHICI